MKFRKALPKDAWGISNVLVKSYSIKTIKGGIATYKNEVKKQHNYIVAVEDKKIAGLVTWVVHGLDRHQLCELDRIAVLPEYRGKGVAKGLFNTLVKNSKAYYKKNNSRLRKLYLLTHSDNKRAQKFYKKLGFKHETTLKQHYYKKKDEYVFSIFFG